MRRAIEVSLLVVGFSTIIIGLWATGFTQDAASQDNVIKKSVDLVSVYFTVRDNKKQLASQLDQGEFRVLEDGKEQAIRFFAHHSDVLLNVGVLLDTGTNMAWILNEEATATSLFMCWCRALNTQPVPPSPSRSRRTYGPRTRSVSRPWSR